MNNISVRGQGTLTVRGNKEDSGVVSRVASLNVSKPRPCRLLLIVARKTQSFHINKEGASTLCISCKNPNQENGFIIPCNCHTISNLKETFKTKCDDTWITNFNNINCNLDTLTGLCKIVSYKKKIASKFGFLPLLEVVQKAVTFNGVKEQLIIKFADLKHMLWL